MGRSIFWCLKPACFRAKHRREEQDEEEKALEEHEQETPVEVRPGRFYSVSDDAKEDVKHNKGFRQEDVEEYKQVFDFFDIQSKGHIEAPNVATTLRSLNPVPDEHLVAKEIAKVGESYGGACNFEQFLEVLHTTIRATKKKTRNQRRRSTQLSISEERRAELKESFDMFDYDNDGTISLDELQTVMASCGIYITEDEANEIIEEFGHEDSEQGNNLNFEEFVELMTSKENNTDANKEIQEAFNFFDKDGSGTISAEEVMTVMLALGEDISDTDVFDMIREADTSGNGEVCYQDFYKILTGGAPY